MRQAVTSTPRQRRVGAAEKINFWRGNEKFSLRNSSAECGDSRADNRPHCSAGEATAVAFRLSGLSTVRVPRQPPCPLTAAERVRMKF